VFLHRILPRLHHDIREFLQSRNNGLIGFLIFFSSSYNENSYSLLLLSSPRPSLFLRRLSVGHYIIPYLERDLYFQCWEEAGCLIGTSMLFFSLFVSFHDSGLW